MSKRITNRSLSPSALIQKLCILYLIIWAVSPPLSTGTIWRLLGLGAVVVWFILEVLSGTHFSVYDIAAVIFILAVVLTSYIESSGFSNVLKQIALYMLALCFIIQTHYYERFSELTDIIPVILLLLIFFNVRTFTVLLTDPTIARRIVRNDEAMLAYLAQGVGGYALIYLQVSIVPALVMYMLKSFHKHKLLFFVTAAWLVTFVLVVANAGYSLAIFTAAVSIIILFIYKGKSAFPALITSAVFLIAAMYSLVYFTGLRNFLLEFFDGTAVAKKINDLLATSETGSAEGSIYDRVKAYNASISAILHYPIIGAFWNGGGGGHSAILDNYAKFGILGGSFYLFSLLSAPSTYKKISPNNRLVLRICNAEITTLFFVGILDSLTYEFMPVIVLLLPVIIQAVLNIADEVNNENTVDG